MFRTPEIERKYLERQQRYLTAMSGGTPDRIPIRFFFQEAAARYAGLTTQQVALDYQLAFECTRRMAEDFQSDAVMLNAIWSNYGVAKAASWKYLSVPGVDMDVNSVLQFGEPDRESDLLMHEDEYDEFVSDPTAFLVNKWMARATTRVKPTGGIVDFEHTAALISGALAYANYMNAFGPAAARLKEESGIVSANAGMIKAPLDILADKFRGYQGMALDTLDRPGDLIRACEALIPHIVANALAGADPDRQAPITIWAHRGCVPFISQESFDTIFWPTLKPVFEQIIAQGYQILFYSEGNWEAHYDALRELPVGSIIYHLTKGSPETAARKLKDRFAISGGVSYDVLARGTPADVRTHLKDLFSWLKPGGGYMLDCTSLMLSDINPDNVRAAVEYTLEHGVYSQSSAIRPRASLAVAPPKGAVPSKGAVPLEGGLRPPHTVRPWSEEKQTYRCLSGDVAAVESAWKSVDAAAYNYLWTTVLW